MRRVGMGEPGYGLRGQELLDRGVWAVLELGKILTEQEPKGLGTG